MAHSRRSRSEWDEFARHPSGRRHRVLGRVLLTMITLGLFGYAVAAAASSSAGQGWPVAFGLGVAAATGMVLLRRVRREGQAWGGEGPAERWVNPPRRGGRR